jgi:parallel beta-helix repeat protein
VGTASAMTWTVDDDGGADFTWIQEVINNASDGDTILVYSGIYYENVVINKSVTLKGIGQPVVDANSSDSAITLTADGITLVGFNATNSGSSWRDVGIKVTSNNNTITGNNVGNNNEGIRLEGSSNNIINGNIFVNDGLSVDNSYHNTVEGNTVNDKPLVYLEDALDYTVEDAGQVILVNCNNITVENLDLSYTRFGITLWKTEDSKVLNNTVSNNYYGISLGDSRNNTIGDNIVCNNRDKGILLYCSGNNHLYLNNFINNTDNADWLWYRQGYESANIWNSTEKITYSYDGTTYESYLGNYWDDYEGTDVDVDGIGDTPYSTNSSYYSIDTRKYENDDYPLIKPFENYIT